jgi:hypothetical protein
MVAPAIKKQGVDGRVKHGHDEVGGWVIGYDGWYKQPLFVKSGAKTFGSRAARFFSKKAFLMPQSRRQKLPEAV